MNLEDIHALDCAVNSVGQLEEVGVCIIPNHTPYLPKDLLKAISTKENNEKATSWIIALSFRDTEINVLDHGHNIEIGLYQNKVSFILAVQGEDEMRCSTKMLELLVKGKCGVEICIQEMTVDLSN